MFLMCIDIRRVINWYLFTGAHYNQWKVKKWAVPLIKTLKVLLQMPLICLSYTMNVIIYTIEIIYIIYVWILDYMLYSITYNIKNM